MAEHANVYPLRREPQREQPQREREPQPEPRPREHQPQEPLWREALGRRLRVLRQEQQETLSETAARAGISPQYLSEIERGRKEPSSEMIAALAGALGTTLIDLTEQVAGDLRRQMSLVPRASRTRPGRARPGPTRRGPTRPGPTRTGDILALAA
ncbi:MAG: helix-turn-helix domain-containing protein [Streptosporangiaceae bacterium]